MTKTPHRRDELQALLESIRALHFRIRASIVEACERQSQESLARVEAEEAGDTLYHVDRISEAVLVEGLRDVAAIAPICVVAEGLSHGPLRLPRGVSDDQCRWRLLIDPIDGTRGLMHQKRSAWILTGVAPNRGAATRLSDVTLAVQTEVPLVKQHLSDELWSVRGEATSATRYNRLTGTREPLVLRPSRAQTLAHGFASLSRFFPGARDVIAAIDDDIAHATVGVAAAGKALCFEDQYLSTAGQLYELMAGHDRFVADIRPLVAPVLAGRGLPRGLCCHPYDLCTVLIAQELGIVITGPAGAAIDAPFDVHTDVSWVGYANAAIRDVVEPALRRALDLRGLLPG